jgi:hypothetical protein
MMVNRLKQPSCQVGIYDKGVVGKGSKSVHRPLYSIHFKTIRKHRLAEE